MIFVFDAFCLLAVVTGLALAFAGARTRGPSAATYGRRIAGVMLAAFGLALGTIATAFHYA